VFIEAKDADVPLSFGRRLTLQRLCDAIQQGGRDSVLLVVNPGSGERIDFAEAPLSEYRWQYRWHEGNGEHLREVVNELEFHF